MEMRLEYMASSGSPYFADPPSLRGTWIRCCSACHLPIRSNDSPREKRPGSRLLSFECLPRIEAVDGGRPGKLVERRQLVAREERDLRDLLGGGAHVATHRMGPESDDEDGRAGSQVCGEQPVELHGEARLLARLADGGL